MIIEQKLLDELSAQAKASPRLRQNYDLRSSADDNSQRMLNAMEPGTVMPIHRHLKTSESVVILRGCCVEKFYDDSGTLTEEVLLRPGSDCAMVHVEQGRWHSLECLESGTVIFEAKDGKWEKLGEGEVMG